MEDYPPAGPWRPHEPAAARAAGRGAGGVRCHGAPGPVAARPRQQKGRIRTSAGARSQAPPACPASSLAHHCRPMPRRSTAASRCRGAGSARAPCSSTTGPWTAAPASSSSRRWPAGGDAVLVQRGWAPRDCSTARARAGGRLARCGRSKAASPAAVAALQVRRAPRAGAIRQNLDLDAPIRARDRPALAAAVGPTVPTAPRRTPTGLLRHWPGARVRRAQSTTAMPSFQWFALSGLDHGSCMSGSNSSVPSNAVRQPAMGCAPLASPCTRCPPGPRGPAGPPPRPASLKMLLILLVCRRR